MVDRILKQWPEAARRAAMCLLMGGTVPAAHAGVMTTTPEIRQAAVVACTGDVLRLCPSMIFDEQKVFECMGANRALLSQSCRTVYDKGAKSVRR